MKFTLEIDCDNAAFGDTDSERGDEVARVLRDLARRVADGYLMVYLRDANGNTVGTAEFKES